jgi:hypothetical protein
MNAPLKTLVAPTAALALAITTINPKSAQALTFYSGLDTEIGPGDPRPNSDAAASTFDTAAASLGTLNTITFEDLAVTTNPSVILAPGVTATWFNNGGNTIVDVNSQTFTESLGLGYNTTPGGHLFAQIAYNYPDYTQPVGVIFTFATPIQAWGAYFTGVGTGFGSTVIQFSDGTLQSQLVVGDPKGGISFLGFTDPSKQITSITVLQTPVGGAAGDIFGLDDMHYVYSIPTPALLPGLIGMGVAVLQKKSRFKG